MTIPIEQQIRCVEREIRMRERVYPRWTAAGKMKPENAEYEIEAMRAVLRTLQAERMRDAWNAKAGA